MAGLRDAQLETQLERQPLMRPLGRGSAPGSEWTQHLAAILGTLLSVSAGTVLGWTSPALPLLGLPEEQQAWVGSLAPLGALLGALPAGLLAERVGRRRLLIGLGLPYLAGFLMLAFADASTVSVAGVRGPPDVRRVHGREHTGAAAVLRRGGRGPHPRRARRLPGPQHDGRHPAGVRPRRLPVRHVDVPGVRRRAAAVPRHLPLHARVAGAPARQGPPQGGERVAGVPAAQQGLRPRDGGHAEDGGRRGGPGPQEKQGQLERRAPAPGPDPSARRHGAVAARQPRRRRPARARHRARRVPRAGADGRAAALRHQRHHLLHGGHLRSGRQLPVALGGHHDRGRRAGGGLRGVLLRGGPRGPAAPAGHVVPVHGPVPVRARPLLLPPGGGRGLGGAAGGRALRVHLLLLVGLRAAALVHDGRAAPRGRQGLGQRAGHRHQLGARLPRHQHVPGLHRGGRHRHHLRPVRRRVPRRAHLRRAVRPRDQGPLPGGHPDHGARGQSLLESTPATCSLSQFGKEKPDFQAANSQHSFRRIFIYHNLMFTSVTVCATGRTVPFRILMLSFLATLIRNVSGNFSTETHRKHRTIIVYVRKLVNSKTHRMSCEQDQSNIHKFSTTEKNE